LAEIVLAVGSSHGPTVQSPPEKWAKLGEGDAFDPRFDYQSLLKAAPAGLDKEITPEVQQRRDAAKTLALGKLTRIIKNAKPDVIVVVSNIHRVEKTGHHPVFGIMRAASFPTAKMSERLFEPEARKHKLDDEKDKYHVYKVDSERPGHPALATYLVNGLIEDGFDVSTHDNFAQGAPLDDAFAFVDKWLFDNVPIPIVPFIISRDLPNQATAARCDDLGKALRKRINEWPEKARVGLIASGGLSHQVVDEELDKQVIKALENGDEATLRKLPRDRLNKAPGTPEILNWVTVAAAMAPTRMKLVDYQPCYRSLAGTGHGIAFGYWQP
jgi:3-O-methylgallate 3,4-dioxygenase